VIADNAVDLDLGNDAAQPGHEWKERMKGQICLDGNREGQVVLHRVPKLTVQHVASEKQQQFFRRMIFQNSHHLLLKMMHPRNHDRRIISAEALGFRGIHDLTDVDVPGH